MSKLLNKYETRIKNFVYKMSENPHIIKKYKGVYSPKYSSPLPNTDTFYQKNAFSFKKYKSDKERIDEILKKNAKLEEYYKKMSVEKERLKKLYQIKFAPTLIQPNMHFQSKNKDSIISKKLSNKTQELTFKLKNEDNYNDEINNLENNLNNLLNKNIDKSKINYTNRSEDILTEEQIRQKKLHKKILQDRKNMINTRKLIMNLDEGNIDKRNHVYSLGEIYRKTEFKAMENLRMFKTSTMNKPILKKWKKEDEEKQINIRIKNLMNLTCNKIKFLNNKNLTRNNKSNFELINNKYNSTNNSKVVPPVLKKMNSADEFDINNHREEIYTNINNKDLHNFNIIKDKSYIDKRKKKLSENNKTLKTFNLSNEISNLNPLLYNLYFFDNESKENSTGINDDKFNQIKKLAFIDNKKDKIVNNNEIDDKENEDTNDEINLDISNNKKIKKLSVDKLAEKILNETNWNLKNKYKAKYDLLDKE